jgi:hypothetical protein
MGMPGVRQPQGIQGLGPMPCEGIATACLAMSGESNLGCKASALHVSVTISGTAVTLETKMKSEDGSTSEGSFPSAC